MPQIIGYRGVQTMNGMLKGIRVCAEARPVGRMASYFERTRPDIRILGYLADTKLGGWFFDRFLVPFRMLH